ncbi:similar to Saccharomyces cerevisiae YOL096C COQ3 O-methyltransferase, catalyzes two different O-methylation steps in ubiquinone (Coenzyme Q) biosynthesis [Maudiozyma saulgeensis]|uniref:Ubiquinone biosynthesis O-methyltransferase, mitochondrial n=1 Tax=Maudiozyma saulgeensis TaxID=1789683 RepID=A0A1X7R8U6_9SACH|nr:similar to Saccharomyces cerevisiae YOL096C COQ3 O-methyltransferase, catalyzes two different O-methylation steps in ubiquinone (Coenzyme Q) biosynthesis [Kazachstania saulgeensis]
MSSIIIRNQPVNRQFQHVARSLPQWFIRHKSTAASPEEIKHFQELAPTWWDTNGSQRILHKMNLARLDFIRNTLNKTVKITDPNTFIPGYNYKEFLPESISHTIAKEWNQSLTKELEKRQYNVLDIGCGGGILSESMARQPFVKQVLGIDLTPDCISVAKMHAKSDPELKGKVEYREVALEDLKQKDYDIITCFEMLEHVDRPGDILEQAWRRLKPDGLLFLSTINRDLISWFTTIFMGETVLKIVPSGTHHLSKYINSSEIEEWFQEKHPRDHKLLDLKGTMYVPTQGWVEHDCARIGNYFMAVKKLH